MNTAVVSVGSNIEPEKNIERAKELLAANYELKGVSSFARTKPVGYLIQPDFTNGAFLVTTELALEDFEQKLKKIEQALGRVRTSNKNGPRTIDLDVTVWNGKVIDNDFYTRDFIRNACCELLPELNQTEM